jgi:radical SAM superfamily enzyme YgiQ (UPF0313 family)
VLKRIKSEHPQIKIVVGGYMADKFPNYEVIDASIMSYFGASEDVFLEYLSHLARGTESPRGQLIFPPLSNGAHRYHYDTATEPKYNIEHDDFKFIKEDYILTGEPLPLDVSRGCIFACRFCQYPHLGKKKLDYIRGMNYMQDEIQYNYEMFGTKNYYVLDDTFNDTEYKVNEFYNMTQRLSFKIDYTAYLRADLIHRFPDTAYSLKESGLSGAFHGIESFHPEASKLVGKAWSGKHGKEFLPKLYHDMWSNEVSQHLGFIAGITGDTLENVNDTARWFIDNEMSSMKIQALGLFGNDQGKSKKTIQSEFDMNLEKYGYTIIPGGYLGQINWQNDNWTRDSAIAESKKIMEQVAPYIKHAAWGTQPLLWYGFTKERLATTAKINMPGKKIRKITAEKLEIYFRKVLGEW